MAPATRKPLRTYLDAEYPFNVIADRDGGYVIVYPDLPGCVSQVDTFDEIAEAAKEIRTLWIETEYESGAAIPEPSFPEEFSGKFVVRLGKSLHRRLVESAQREGVSLNQYVMTLLDKADTLVRVQSQLDRIETGVAAIDGAAVRGAGRTIRTG